MDHHVICVLVCVCVCVCAWLLHMNYLTGIHERHVIEWYRKGYF